MDAPARPVSALILDLDGVVTDTARQHAQAWQQTLEDAGLPYDHAAYERTLGRSRADSLRELLGARTVGPARFEQLLASKDAAYRASLATLTGRDILPGTLELILDARADDLLVAIGSSSRNTAQVLAALGIRDLFDAVADGHAGAPKPAPDIFLAAAHLLAVDPRECLVVEDAPAGVLAARAAGMRVIGIGPAGALDAADLRLTSTAELRAADLHPPRAHPIDATLTALPGWSIAHTAHPDEPVDLDLTLHPDPAGAWTTRARWTLLPPTAPNATAHATSEPPHRERSEPGPSPVRTRDELRSGRRLRTSPLAPGDAPVSSREEADGIALEEQWFTSLVQPELLARRQTLQAPPGTCLRLELGLRWSKDTAGDGADAAPPVEIALLDDAVVVTRPAKDPSHPAADCAVQTVELTGGRVQQRRDDTTDPDGTTRWLDIEVGAEGRVTCVLLLTTISHVHPTPDRVTSDVDQEVAGQTVRADALHDARAIAAAGWNQLLIAHALAWQAHRRSEDVRIEGDPVAQVVLRHALAPLATTAARGRRPSERLAPWADHVDPTAHARTAADDLLRAARALLRPTRTLDDARAIALAHTTRQTLIEGCLGLAVSPAGVALQPQLPDRWHLLCLPVEVDGHRLEIELEQHTTRVRAPLENPGPIVLLLPDGRIELPPGGRT